MCTKFERLQNNYTPYLTEDNTKTTSNVEAEHFEKYYNFFKVVVKGVCLPLCCITPSFNNTVEV